jgi:hypothetical protein
VISDRAANHRDVRTVCLAVDGPDLDLHAGHGLRHGDDQRAHVSADIEDDRALAGMRILRMRAHNGSGHGDVVPGIVW